MIGKTLAHYEILALLGKGGMGEVYRARDTKLGREVALKFLASEFASDPERLRRFEREARVLAALDHPNIATVFALHEDASRGLQFIAMELVDGMTLAARLGASRIPLDQITKIILQIADALESAHEGAVVHRDLKPANIQLTPGGDVKVLDFGLARSMHVDDANAETELALTQEGIVLGTAPYMSPEQAQGKPVDRRTDIWALGCILYECLSGRRAFQGKTATELITKIATEDPDFDAIPADTPAYLIGLLRRCLEKDPRMRLRDAGELRVAIEMALVAPDDVASQADSGGGLWRMAIPWSLVIILLMALGYVFVETRSSERAAPGVSRWRIPLPEGMRVDLPGPGGKFDYSNVVAVSRDGSAIAFSVFDQEQQAHLYVKEGAIEPRRIPGATNVRAPVFSPDGEWLAFYANDSIWKVALKGGSPQKICAVGGRAISFDAAWSADGNSILFTNEGIWWASLTDGNLRRLTSPDAEHGELGHHFPKFTTDGSAVLFTVSTSEQTHLAMMPLDDTRWEILVEDAAMGIPVDGALVFARRNELFAVPFDGRRPTGSAQPVFQGVHSSPGLGGAVVTWFDLSPNGTLAYVPEDPPRPNEQLLWVDENGAEELLVEGPGTWVHPRLSPDGRRISLDIHSPDGMRDVYIYELDRRQFQQLTHTGVTWESEWRADGSYISTLSGIRPGTWGLYQIRTDFSSSLELVAAVDHAVPGGWLDSDQTIVFTEWNSGGIYRARIGDGAPPQNLLPSVRRAGFPRVSPEGDWMVFVAEESDAREVFVTSYAQAGPIYKVSSGGGREPVWSRDGSKLFYRDEDKMLVVDVEYVPSISFSRPRVLFEGTYDAAEVGHQHYDVSMESDRFLMIKHGVPSGPTEVHVVLNWAQEIRRNLQ